MKLEIKEAASNFESFAMYNLPPSLEVVKVFGDYCWWYSIIPTGSYSSLRRSLASALCLGPPCVIADLSEDKINLRIPAYLSDMQDLVRKYESLFDREITIAYQDNAPRRKDTQT